MFREVSVVEAREVLRLWLRKYSLHEIARMVVIDRKTVRRYVDAAVEAGLDRERSEGQLSDELLGAVIGGPHRSTQRARRELAATRERAHGAERWSLVSDNGWSLPPGKRQSGPAARGCVGRSERGRRAGDEAMSHVPKKKCGFANSASPAIEERGDGAGLRSSR